MTRRARGPPETPSSSSSMESPKSTPGTLTPMPSSATPLSQKWSGSGEASVATGGTGKEEDRSHTWTSTSTTRHQGDRDQRQVGRPVRIGQDQNGNPIRIALGETQYSPRFAAVGDIVGHEFTHAITQETARLVYKTESGALNESYSDIFGQLAFPNATNPWKVGVNLGTGGKPLRDMKTPENTATEAPGVGRYSQYQTGGSDEGLVHTNSGIGNRAAVLLHDGDPGVPSGPRETTTAGHRPRAARSPVLGCADDPTARLGHVFRRRQQYLAGRPGPCRGRGHRPCVSRRPRPGPNLRCDRSFQGAVGVPPGRARSQPRRRVVRAAGRGHDQPRLLRGSQGPAQPAGQRRRDRPDATPGV